jgi:ATP-binding cassette subfamily E protein 1
MPPKKESKADEEQKLRIAIISADRCRPKKCRQECKKSCPVVRTGQLCVEVTPESKISWISETLCIGCGICVKKCPFEAIEIINLPKDLSSSTTHRYGPNAFKLHRLPMPRPGHVLGLVGTNGIGKSTALKILHGQLKPNLGRYDSTPGWKEILDNFRGSELQNYFKAVVEGNLRAVLKMQYVDHLRGKLQGVNVGEVLRGKDERGVRESLTEILELGHLYERNVDQLSGGELQRFAIAVAAMAQAEVYMFDEPSSYLDVKQRINAAAVIRGVQQAPGGENKYCIVVEHDLAVLDYLSDFVCCLWGKPGAYGVVTAPFGVREGINVFLDGFIPTENMRFREVSLSFKTTESSGGDDVHLKKAHARGYPKLVKQMGKFKLTVEEGNFTSSEIIVMLGQNGTGKTTFIRMLANLLKPDADENGNVAELPDLHVSYKPQEITPKFQGTVKDLLLAKIRDQYLHPQFQSDVVKPLNMDALIDQDVQVLSGGELQRVALVLALGKPADMYLLDEPSAYLDVEQRIVAAKVIKRFILHSKKTAFIVEHDFVMATYLADRVIVYDGEPGVDCVAGSPQGLVSGMNKFLCNLGITFRRDPTNFRPRINKAESQKDKEQRQSGNYFALEE